MGMVEVKNVTKQYGKSVTALRDVSLSLETNRFYGIKGHSGSGKTTLLQIIGLLDGCTSGELYINGENTVELSEGERSDLRMDKIGFIFQSFHLIPELNVEQNIIFPLLLDYKKPDQGRVDEILQVLGLENRRKHLPGQLSGGQQQRVAIGRALITRPALVLADEPTGNLDSQSSQDVMDLLCRASRHYQQTVLMITHNRNLTASADRVFRVADGELSELGGASE